MRQDKLTTKFQQALADAQSLAIGHDNQMIEPQHLLLALLPSIAWWWVRRVPDHPAADVTEPRRGRSSWDLLRDRPFRHLMLMKCAQHP